MKHYFQLQITMMKRLFSEVRINPLFGIISSIILFVFISILLFEKTTYANYIYCFISISLTSKLSEVNRTTFLKICFDKVNYYQLRIVENSLASLPFVFFLTYKFHLSSALLLLITSIVLAFVNFENKLNFTLITPFKKNPYEFIIGFRRAFILIIAAYSLAVIAVQVDNFNLGIFALGFLLMLCVQFYGIDENEFYVWVHARSSAEFLKYKLKFSFLHSIILSAPLIVFLLLFFPSKALAIMVVFILGQIVSLLSILAKYSKYPQKVDLPMSLLIAMSIMLFPTLLILIPYLFKKAICNLKVILQ
jgi:hypothetical protein